MKVIERLFYSSDLPYTDINFSIQRSRYLPIKDWVAGKSILDAACGEGVSAFTMATYWKADHVTAVDVSEEAIINANKQFPAPNLKFIRSSVEEFISKTEKKFDVIVSVETLEHVDNPKKIIEGFLKILKPNGIIYLTVPNDQYYFGIGSSLNWHHKHVFDFGSIKSLAESVLGKGHWSFGTFASGFQCLSEKHIKSAETWGEVPYDVISTDFFDSVVIPAKKDKVLSPDTAVYFAGIWGYGSNKNVELKSAGTLISCRPNYRFSKVGVLPEYARKKNNDNCLLIVADNEFSEAGKYSLWLQKLLDSRLGVKLIFIDSIDQNEFFQKVLLEKVAHIHVFAYKKFAPLFFDNNNLQNSPKYKTFVNHIGQKILSVSLLPTDRIEKDIFLLNLPFFEGYTIYSKDAAEKVRELIEVKRPFIIDFFINELDEKLQLALARRWLAFFSKAEEAHEKGIGDARRAYFKSMRYLPNLDKKL